MIRKLNIDPKTCKDLGNFYALDITNIFPSFDRPIWQHP
jgi:hypothetical protein